MAWRFVANTTPSQVRVPLLIRVPWAPQSAGRVVSAPVELVELFPTLAGLAGVDIGYTSHESQPLDGRDLSPLFFGGAGDDTHVARSVYPRCVPTRRPVDTTTAEAPEILMGYSTPGDERGGSRRGTVVSLENCRQAGRRRLYDHGDTGTRDGARGERRDASGRTSPATIVVERRLARRRLLHRCPCFYVPVSGHYPGPARSAVSAAGGAIAASTRRPSGAADNTRLWSGPGSNAGRCAAST